MLIRWKHKEQPMLMEISFIFQVIGHEQMIFEQI